MDITPEELENLPHIISEPRFATYLKATGGDKERAICLYLWNLRVSAALLVPLQICEVTVRNGVAEAITQVHGANWPWVNGFIRSLPTPKKKWHYNPQDDLMRTAKRLPTTGKVIAEVSFAFWEKTFTAGQDRRLWNDHMHKMFPGFDTGLPAHKARGLMASDLFETRKVRNRIAHHEPIFGRDILADYERMKMIVGRRSEVTATWLDKIQSVKELLSSSPL